jgi:V/A-type H+-transporting ATPase subunit E
MDAENVVEKIMADARQEAEKIKSQAADKFKAEWAESSSRLEEYRQQTDAIARKAGADAKAQVLSSARMELAKEKLAGKAKMLDEVFAKAEQRLKTMPDEQYRLLMTKLMAESAQTGDEEVIIDVNEKRIDQSLIDQVNSRKQSNLKLSGQRETIGGGFILKKGKIKNNCSLKVLLSRAGNELEMELAKQLFGD